MRLRFALLGSLLAVLVAVVAPNIASAAPQHNRGLTINATPNPIIAGEGVLIYGQLRGGDVAGQPVKLYHRVNPSTQFTLIGKTTTNTFGFYEFTRVEGIVYTNRSWFVRGLDGAHSRTIHERVAAEVSLTANMTTADTGQPIVFSGHVTPNHAFQRVFLQVQKGATDNWSTVASTRLGPGSNYTISRHWRMPGQRVVRVSVPRRPSKHRGCVGSAVDHDPAAPGARFHDQQHRSRDSGRPVGHDLREAVHEGNDHA